MTGHWNGLAVTATGTGPAVLWIHGYTMRWQVWHPVWSHLPGWRHVGLDLPWHGDSRPLGPGEDLAALADAVTSAASSNGIRHVVALSFGTVLAVEMARRHPDAARSWTLVAPALAGMPHGPAVQQRYRDLAALYHSAGPGPHLTELWMSCPPDIFAAVRARPAVHAAVRALIDLHRWDELAEGGIRRLTDQPQRAADLAVVPAPVLLLIGDGDLLHHRACARSILAATPSASLAVLPGTGHLPLLEEPAAAAAVLAGHLTASERG